MQFSVHGSANCAAWHSSHLQLMNKPCAGTWLLLQALALEACPCADALCCQNARKVKQAMMQRLDAWSEALGRLRAQIWWHRQGQL